jgi:hypothetical protein
MVFLDERNSIRVCCAIASKERFGLIVELLQIGPGRQLFRHDDLLSNMPVSALAG